MYDDVLFPVSFYFLDDDDLTAHGRAIAEAFEARIHVLTMVLEDESRSDRGSHEEIFDRFVDDLGGTGSEVTSEFRGDPVAEDDVAEAILDETERYDLVVMGHARRRQTAQTGPTTAERVINGSDVPTLVVPLTAPRFRGGA